MTESAVLKAMGMGDRAAGSAIRLSWGWDSGPQDAERFWNSWTQLLRRKNVPMNEAVDAA